MIDLLFWWTGAVFWGVMILLIIRILIGFAVDAFRGN